MPMSCPGGGWWGAGGALLWLLFLALIVVGAVVLVRALWPGRREEAPSDGALRILEERYARGEIDGQEFEERRNALRS